MAKAVKTRPLTDIEKSWITEHFVKDKLTVASLQEKLPGVKADDIQEFVAKSVAPEPKPEQSAQERQKQLGGMSASKFMGRDPERGVAVMTQTASEIADARRIVSVPSPDSLARQKTDRIVVINPDKRVR